MKMILAVSALLPLAVVSQAQAATSLLDTVIEKRELRVCTTGDYKPYTYLRDDGEYEGIDISMTRSLAESLGAKVTWVPTTWKTLTPDYLSGQCDIAVGGISVSLPRQKVAYFSNPVSLDGKIPFVRCEDVQRYQTVEQINQPNVRLIEPAGGTNEAFVRANLPKAQVELFHDNVTIFHKLVRNEADVMITDASEALYQQRFIPELCAVNPDQVMQYIEKAYLLPRGDEAFKRYVDQWLHLEKASGRYQKIADQWIGQTK